MGDIQRFLGTVNQVSKFAPNLTEVYNKTTSRPADQREPVDVGKIKGQQLAFNEVKQLLTTTPVLALFVLKFDTTLLADALSYGLGAVLLQRQSGGELKPVAYVSTYL